MAKYVIIGNSTAAIGCVEGIRSKDKDGEIVLIASENHHTYARPLISYLLQGKTDEERMKYRPDSFYEENHVTAKLGETVTKLDPEKKNVTLKSGEEIPYEKLLVATQAPRRSYRPWRGLIPFPKSSRSCRSMTHTRLKASLQKTAVF